MSMAADIVSLELIAAVHQFTEMDQGAYDLLVHRLHQQVAHFEWVGLYLYDDQELSLRSSAGEQSLESIARKSILQIPIPSPSGKLLGKLTVTCKKAVAFDESDFNALTALASEIGAKLNRQKQEH